MCKKLMFLISLVSVLVLAGIGSAADYEWDGDSPYSVLFVDPCNWDPLAPYGPDDCDDTAYIPSVGHNPTVVITAPTVYRLNGPAFKSDSDGEILLVQDADLTVCDRWRPEETDGCKAYITLVDRARATMKEFRAHEDEQNVVISMFDDSEWVVLEDMRMGKYPDESMEIYMTDNASMNIGYNDYGLFNDEANLEVYLTLNAVIEAKHIRLRGKGQGTTLLWDQRDDTRTTITDGHFQFAGGESFTVNLFDNSVMEILDGDFRGGEDNDFKAPSVWTLTMPCGDDPLLDIDGDLRMIDDDDASGFGQIYLHGGTIIVGGEIRSDTDDWNIDICCNGVLIVDGDVVDDILDWVDDGHITICGGTECGTPYDLIVDYNGTDNQTTVSLEHDPYQAYDPDPGCCTDPDAEDVLPELCLSWTAGDSPCPPPIVFYVFLSTDYDKVANGDLSALVCNATEATECCVEDLCLGATYYWRVDSVCECYTAPGDVWCFKVVDCIIYDDFESYDNSCDPETALYETWLDGAGDCNGIGGNGTGSTAFSATDPDPEQEDKVMEYFYNSTGSEREYPYSEVHQVLDSLLDVTDDCEKLLALWFYGDPDNMTESMWVVLSDGTTDGQITYGTLGPDSPDDIKNAEWRDFIVDLQDFADAGVDISAITDISIGFGERGRVGEFPGDPVGVVYFDDLSFCATTCIPRYARDGDIDEDCDVDWDDVALMHDDWLEVSDNYGYCPK
jgi:hypothetical protein